MKKLLAATVALGFSASVAVAGPYTSHSSKGEVTPPPPMGCVCFDGGAIEVSAFAAGLIPSDSGQFGGLEDGFGGGVGLGYFFTANIGVEVSYAAISQDSTAHLINGSIVVRAPLTDLCIAPYLLVGGGLHTNGITEGTYHAGGGLDIRLDSAGCMGIFADAVYTFADESEDYTFIRLGVRKNF